MDDLRDKYLQAIAAVADESALEDLRVQAVGKKGEISLKMRDLGKMTPEERKTAGPKLNALKDDINTALAARKAALADQGLQISAHPDIGTGELHNIKAGPTPDIIPVVTGINGVITRTSLDQICTQSAFD